MVNLSIKVVSKDNCVLAESADANCASLIYGREYVEGDRIVLSSSVHNLHVIWQVDDALGEAMCYLSSDVTFHIPFGEKKRAYSPKTFIGNKHYLFVRVAEETEIYQYRNLAKNAADQHRGYGCYPHASANVETRAESVFAARNAIDGLLENHGHGMWPYTSWGINRDPNAEIKLEFGRKVLIDHIRIYLRADFPHDSHWIEGIIRFSDGSYEVLKLQKTDRGQDFPVSPREIESLTFGNLIKAEDASPFPALTQIEVYGKDTEK